VRDEPVTTLLRQRVDLEDLGLSSSVLNQPEYVAVGVGERGH
jgi:hypothetical protein